MNDFVGMIPEFCSFSKKNIESLASAPSMRKPLSSEEKMQGLIFKGPFVVKHPRFKRPFICVDLQAVNEKTLAFFDGDKFFQILATGKVRWANNEIVIPYMSEGDKNSSVKIRRLMESDIDSSSEKLSLDAFAKRTYKEITSDPYDI